MNITSYHTDQKEMIIRFFEQNNDRQITVSDIKNELLNSNQKIGLATIYRQLEALEKIGLIKKFADESGKKSCWQYVNGNVNCSFHYHLKCEKCGKIIHLDCKFVSEIDSHILKEHKFNMDRSKTIFYGICENCI